MTGGFVGGVGGGTTFKMRVICGESGDEDADNIKHIIKYDLWRADGEYPAIDDAIDAFDAGRLTTVRGLPMTSYSYAEDDDGNNHLIFTATHSTRPATSIMRVGFDTTGGTIKLTASKATSRYPATGRTAPDFKGAIGVKNTGKDAEPEGVDIIIPGLKLTFTYRWPAGAQDLAYVKQVAGLTGRTNNATFHTFDEGELLFLGMTGELAPVGANEFQYHFLASSNATGLTIGEITGIAKKGHDYLWVVFEADQDTTAKKLVQRPLAAYVERVYDPADFGILDIGGT